MSREDSGNVPEATGDDGLLTGAVSDDHGVTTGAGGRRARWRTGLAMVLVALVAVVLATVALLAVARFTPVPALFLGAGLVTFLAVTHTGAALVAARRVPPEHRRTARWALSAGTAVPLVVLFVVTALVPPTLPPPEPAIPGQTLVEVSTSSRLAVIRLPARTQPARAPVVVLHGGPGVPDLRANAEVFAPLTEHGFDVHLYAQLGTGASTRLPDPRGYGRDRDVADLEALRERLGLERMVLIGHSYGGALAASYLARHPDRVTALVLVSPGALDPADHSSNRATAGLTTAQRLRLYGKLLAPRALLGYGLLQVNPAAAHAYLPDAEADVRNDNVVGLAAPGLHCPGAPARPAEGGTGFYAMQYPQSATTPPPDDPRPALRGLPTPTLIIKGSCDYLSWHSATEYRDLLPQTQLLYLPGTGHNAHQDVPELVRAAVLAFLDQQPLPLAPYQGAAPPADYQGPP